MKLLRQIRNWASILVKHPRLITHLQEGRTALSHRHFTLELGKAKEIARSVHPGEHGHPVHTFGTMVKTYQASGLCEHVAFLYGVCKSLRPETVLETGVRRGASSHFILSALRENQCGHLYSIDLPNAPEAELAPGTKTGYLVPQELRNRWSLILGDSKLELPRLCREIERVDMFVHDSLHTYEHMIFEFETVWDKIPLGGLLVSDDVTWNTSFSDFCHSRGQEYLCIEGSGICVKTAGA